MALLYAPYIIVMAFLLYEKYTMFSKPLLLTFCDSGPTGSQKGKHYATFINRSLNRNYLLYSSTLSGQALTGILQETTEVVVVGEG